MPVVRMLPAGIRLDVPRGTRLSDAIRQAGLPIAAPCGDELICAKCGLRIVEGSVDRESEVERTAKERNRVPAGYRLACALRVRGDLTVHADYWGPAPARAAVLLLVDHGSRRPEAHRHLEWTAEQVRRRRPGLRVHVAHLELSPPSVAEALARCAAEGERQVDVLPLFLIPGRHSTHDLPEQIARAAAEHPGVAVRLLEPLGNRPEIADLILASLAGEDPG
jgi:sirohydrochlorin cobaltochelatase